MRRSLYTFIFLYAAITEGSLTSWKGGGSDTSTRECITTGERCGSGAEASGCCTGQCCTGGRCKACQSLVEKETASPTAGLVGDLLTDFAGRHFTFPGISGEVYSLVTEADHQVNAILYPEDGYSRELGITLRGVGIHGPDTSLRIAVDSQGRLAVELNERPFRGTQMRLDGVTATAGCIRSQCGEQQIDGTALTVSDSFMTLWAWVKDGSPAVLNFKITLVGRPLSQVHGILGQTLEGNFVAAAPSAQFALPLDERFYGEGQPSDYSTTDLFSSDSTFSVFTRKIGRRRHRRKRSMLEGNALAALALASRGAGASRQGGASGRSRPQTIVRV